MAESFREHAPGYRLTIFLVDRLTDAVRAAAEPLDGVELIPVERLGIPDFAGMCARYDVVELSTAVKPHCFRALMDRQPGTLDRRRRSADRRGADRRRRIPQSPAGTHGAEREAARIATDALMRTIPQIAPGQNELAIAGILEKALRDEGSEEAPFPPIVASGPRSALPHARASARVVEKGDLLLLDFGAQYRGYCSDITRTFIVGPPTPEQREIYQVVRDANHIASHSVRAGMTGMAADALARSYIDAQGHGEAFGHSLGHGLGLEVHESPRLARTAEAALVAGAVVTIEPGIYRPGWGGVRIEDDVHLSENGPQILTNFSRELIEVA